MSGSLTEYYNNLFLQPIDLKQFMPVLQVTLRFLHHIKYIYTSGSYVKLLQFGIAYGVLYASARKISNAYFGSLRNIPGPFVCKFINLPVLFYGLPFGTLYRSINAIHKEYGNVVRLGPNTISIADSDMMKQVLLIKDLKKGPSYGFLAKTGETFFNTSDKVFHKKMRRLASSAFSDRYIRSLEPYMQLMTRDFIYQIDKRISSTMKDEITVFGTVNIWKMLQHHSIDMIGETVFGETFHTIKDDHHSIPKKIEERMRLGGIAMMFPQLSKFLCSLFYNGKQDPHLTKVLLDIISKRKDGTKPRRNDILQALLDTQDAVNVQDRLSTEEIVTQSMLFLIAGAETTSDSMGFAFIELLKNPDKLKKLYDEIDTVPMVKCEEGECLQHDDLKRLPYLNAVINETMRLNPVATSGLERVTTEDTVIGDTFILPKDIIIKCDTFSVHTNEEYWVDTLSFVPERWIKGTKENEELKDNGTGSFLPFSLGSRNCIGKTFALQEMRITIATLVKHFEFVAIPEELERSKDKRAYIGVCLADPNVNVKMRRRTC